MAPVVIITVVTVAAAGIAAVAKALGERAPAPAGARKEPRREGA